jgi:hypothetical protein
MILPYLDLSRTLFIDIETVSEKGSYKELDDNFKMLWAKKSGQLNREAVLTEEIIEKSYFDKAGIFSEFAKVVCISVGFLRKEGNNLVLRLKSFKSDDEKEVLMGLTQLLYKGFNDPLNSFLCGHNIKEFDIPFLCRRMMIHGIDIPDIIQVAGKKPWETKQFIDTLELWKFGDNKNYTSLILLAAVLGIPSPKDDIDGSEVGSVYWVEKDLDRISTYCQKDVKTVVQVLLRMQGKELLQDEQIEFT